MAGEIRQPDSFAIGIYLIVFPLMLYTALIRGANRTKITKRSGMIEVLYGPIPVPWRPRARSFRVDEIAHLDHVDEAEKGVVLRKISLVLRDSTRFSLVRWPIPVADAVMQQLRSMIG